MQNLRKSKLHVKNIFCFLWLFLATLQSFYFYELGLALPPFLSSMMAAIGCIVLSQMRLRKDLIILVRPIGYLLFYIAFLGSISLINSSGDFYLSRFFALPLYLSSALFFLFLAVNDWERLAKLLKTILWIHLFCFYTQVVSHYGFGFVIDFLSPFTGESQRVIGGNYEHNLAGGGVLLRPSGLFNEPGTYACYTFLLYIMYRYFWHKDLAYGKLELIDYLYFTSVLLSFSIFGFVLLGFYMAASALRNPRNNVIIISIITLCTPLLVTYYIAPRFFSGQYDETGINFRVFVLENFLNYSADNNYLNIIFGVGFFSDMSSVFGDYALNDLGFAFFGFFTFGVLGFLTVSYGLRSGKMTTALLISVTILFLTKVSPSSFFFWIYIAFISIIANKKIRNRINCKMYNIHENRTNNNRAK